VIVMADAVDLDTFWETAPMGQTIFQHDQIAHLPDPAQRYLAHAIEPGTPLARAVRLSMHGTIKLNTWRSFEAEEVIRWDRGMIWSATVRMMGLPVYGSDRLVDGSGAQRWKLLGLIPVMSASGPDVARSTAGRLAAEAVWLPSVLVQSDVTWTAVDEHRARAAVTVQGEAVDLTLTVDSDGRLEAMTLPRWGDPGDGSFREEAFGGLAEAERTIGGYTIPTQLRIGWYPGTDRFAPEGEFFRATVGDVTFR
jgi:hypothetical protein